MRSQPEVCILYCQVDTLSHFLSYTIIKRRVAWLIGKWVSEECYLANHPRIWEVLARLISPEIETVVRLTAAAALRDCVDVRLYSFIGSLRTASSLISP